jgi:hypothetical protein
MKYLDKTYGFSFLVPDGWNQLDHVMPLTFVSAQGGIQVRVSTIRPDFSEAAARERYMLEPGMEVVSSPVFGNETMNIVHLRNRSRNEGWLSVVRDGIHYELTWDHDEREQMRNAVKQMGCSFEFMPMESANKLHEIERQMTPGQKVMQDLLTNAPASSVEAVQRIQAAGMVPITKGKVSVGYGILKKPVRKWWEFWRGIEK